MIIQFYKHRFTKQYDQIQNAYFGPKSYSIFTACCYFIDQDEKTAIHTVTVISENSDH